MSTHVGVMLPITRNWIVPPEIIVGVLLQRLEASGIYITKISQAELDAVAGKFVVDGMGLDGSLTLTLGLPGDH